MNCLQFGFPLRILHTPHTSFLAHLPDFSISAPMTHLRRFKTVQMMNRGTKVRSVNLESKKAVGMLMMVIREIGRERAFSMENERWMKGISAMAALECAYIFAGLIGWSCVGIMHPGVMILALALIMFGAGMSILTWALAKLIRRASDIQQENDLTI